MTDHLFDLPGHGADDEVSSLLSLIAGDPIHDHDRRRIVAAIVADARKNRGLVDMNRVRAKLTHPNTKKLDVLPQLVGAVTQSLVKRRCLTRMGYMPSTDTAGHNAGKPINLWRLVQAPAEVGSSK